EEVEVLPDGESVEEDVVLRAETEGATNLEHRERRTLSRAVVTEQCSDLTLKTFFLNISFLKREVPYVFDRPVILTAILRLLSVCSIWNS
ncbi:hypothetical protein PENTCL1PPCAC_14198, partial [Pristionchus entomophagus]